MVIIPGTTNGVPNTGTYFTRYSDSDCIISSNSIYWGQSFYIKAINTSPITKTVPVTFYRITNGTTATISTATWNESTALVTANLGTGTHQIYAVWPGEGRYAGFSTRDTTRSLAISAGQIMSATPTLTKSPTTGVINEPVTFNVAMTTSTNCSGTIVNIYSNGSIKASARLNSSNQGSTVTTFSSTGTYTLQPVWNGGNVGGTFYQAKPGTTSSYTIALLGTLNATLSLSESNSLISTIEPITFTAVLNTSTILTDTTVSFSGGTTTASNVITVNTVTSVASSVGATTYNTGTAVVVSAGSPNSWNYVHANGSSSTTSTSTSSNSVSTSTTTSIVAIIDGQINFLTTTTNAVGINSATNYVSVYGPVGDVHLANGATEGLEIYIAAITATGPNWLVNTNVNISYLTIKQNNNWWAVTSSQGNAGSYNPWTIAPIKGTASTATFVSGYWKIYSAQSYVTTITTTTTTTTTATALKKANILVTPAITLINNSATTTIPANSLIEGDYAMTAVWNGKSTTPKYASITSNTVSWITRLSATPSIALTVTPSTYRRYDSAGTANPSTIVTATIVVGTGFGNGHNPTGTIGVYDVGTNSLLTSTTITTSGTYNLQWNPITGNQYQQGLRTIRALYSGDNYNLSVSTTATFQALGSNGAIQTHGYFTVGGQHIYPDPGADANGVIHLTTSSTATCYTPITFKWVNYNTSSTYTATNFTGTITVYYKNFYSSEYGYTEPPHAVGTFTLVNNQASGTIGLPLINYWYPSPLEIFWTYSGNEIYEGKWEIIQTDEGVWINYNPGQGSVFGTIFINN